MFCKFFMSSDTAAPFSAIGKIYKMHQSIVYFTLFYFIHGSLRKYRNRKSPTQLRDHVGIFSTVDMTLDP